MDTLMKPGLPANLKGTRVVLVDGRNRESKELERGTVTRAERRTAGPALTPAN